MANLCLFNARLKQVQWCYIQTTKAFYLTPKSNFSILSATKIKIKAKGDDRKLG